MKPLKYIIKYMERGYNMKKMINNSKEGIILAFVFSFMLFIYEPICLYSSNMDDFYFDLYAFLPYILLEFITSFLVISIIFLLVNKYIKKWNYIFYILLFIVFFAMYIEGNYLTAYLPVLDGSKISWSSFTVPTIISTFIWVAVPIIVFILLKKFKFDKIKKYANYAVMIIFVMILSGLISLSVKPNLFEHRTYVITTQKNINNI